MLAWYYEIKELDGHVLKRGEERFAEREEALRAAVDYLKSGSKVSGSEQLCITLLQELVGGDVQSNASKQN